MVRFTDKGDGVIGIGVWAQGANHIGRVHYLEYENDSVCIKGMFRGGDRVNSIDLPIGCFCSIVVAEDIDNYRDDWASLFITVARILKVDNGEATFISHEELKVNGRDRLFSFAHQDNEDSHEGMIQNPLTGEWSWF